MNKPEPADLDRPFSGFPVCSRYAPIGSIEEARQRVCRMLDRGETLGVVMGPPGTGKTLLCQKIASLYRHSHAIVTLGDIRVSSRLGLIQQVLFHLGKPHHGADEGSLHLALVQSLTQSVDSPRPLLLIVDEAQMLSSELLDEVRMMTNLVRLGRPLVQTLLVGGPRLEDTLADPCLESLTQRIAVRCYLHPMNHAEADAYVRGAIAPLALPVDPQAVSLVHHASGGIPRLINQLMDQAIEFARSRGKAKIDDACVQLAWAELQQLPSPVLEAELRPTTAAVEFGELDEHLQHEPAALAASHEPEPACEPAAEGCVSCPEPSPKCSAAEPQFVAGDEPVADELTEDTDGSDATLSPYSNMASILEATSIDCLSQAADESHSHWTAPVSPEDDLFGSDFEQELPLEMAACESSPATPDPAALEWSLHEEIRRLSATAGAARSDRGRLDLLAGETLDPAPQPIVQPETSVALPAGELPEEMLSPLAVVWSDEEVTEMADDDRDLLIIEDDVAMLADSPRTSMVASGALRKPTREIEQNYQNLFSRLRRGQ